MIRVNLLPRRREAKREGSQAWMAVAGVMLLAELVIILVMHAQKKKELDTQVAANKEVEAEIADKTSKTSEHEHVKKQLAEFAAREEAITKLQVGRSGPTAMLLELARILSPRKMPTIDADVYERLRRENPLAVPTESWDPHRLWLTSLKESEHTVTLSGVGKSNDDVAEFLRRVALSRYFGEVRLVKTEEMMDKDASGVSYAAIGFDLRAKVRY